MSKDGLRISVQQLSLRTWRCAAPNDMCSCMVVAGERDVLVADSMVTPGLARQVKDAVRDLTGRPVRYLLTTHGDSDHILGNQEFSPESVLLGHRLTRERLLREGDSAINAARKARPFLAAELEQARVVAPEVTFDGGAQIDLGGIVVECMYLGPAHTPGDVAVWVPQDHVLYTADLVFNQIFPVLRNADVAGWLRALDRLEALEPEVVAVSHGDVGGCALIGEMRSLLTTVRDAVVDARERGLTLEQALVEVRFPAYEDLPRADVRIAEAIQRVYRFEGLDSR